MKISVLTPTIPGREHWLWRAKCSVRGQTSHCTRQHIIVDGNGLTPAAAFQQALDQASGDYIMPLADDDWIAPHTFDMLGDLLDAGADFATGRTLIYTREQEKGRHKLIPPHPVVVGERLDPDRIAKAGFTLGGAHMWRKKLTDQHGGFNETFDHAADYELYWRLAKTGCQTAFTPEILYFYTAHPNTDGELNAGLIAKQCAQIRELHL